MIRQIKAFENSKAEGYLSGFWGGKSEQEKEKDEQEIAVSLLSLKFTGL